jgi:hypothetical protein
MQCRSARHIGPGSNRLDRLVSYRRIAGASKAAVRSRSADRRQGVTAPASPNSKFRVRGRLAPGHRSAACQAQGSARPQATSDVTALPKKMREELIMTAKTAFAATLAVLVFAVAGLMAGGAAATPLGAATASAIRAPADDQWIAVRIGRGGGAVHRGGGTVHRGGGTVHRGGGTVHRGGSTVHRGGSTVRRGGVAVHRGGVAVQRSAVVRRGGVATVRPVRRWVRRPYYGTVVGGVALGTIIAATAVATAPAAPASGLCWYWADSSMNRGYWDYCR